MRLRWRLDDAATEIRLQLDAETFRFDNVGASLTDAANHRAFKIGNYKLCDDRRRSLLVALYGNELQLWGVYIRESPNCTALRVPTIQVDGATGNTARFLTTYFKPNLPIEKLKLLAAHIILAGHKVDGGVDGLHMATCGKTKGYLPITDEEKDALRKRSSDLDEVIQSKLFD